jgi:hypothetical protein
VLLAALALLSERARVDLRAGCCAEAFDVRDVDDADATEDAPLSSSELPSLWVRIRRLRLGGTIVTIALV